MKRIGILGGTFNPIHNGHLAIAQAAREQFELEKVLFMPSGVPYMKNPEEVLPASVRCKMTSLAIREIPHFALSDMEAVAEGNTYTGQTLEKLKSMHSDTEYYFIMGADSLYAIETWRNPEQIFKNCTILAAMREEPAKRNLQAQARYLREKYHASVELLKTPGMNVSSTLIRSLLQRGESIRGLTPKAVEIYITENHLYC